MNDDKRRAPDDSPGAPDSGFNAGSTLAADPDAWRATAEDAVLTLAASGREFDADAVRALGVVEPPVANWWGLVFSGLHRAGYIVPVDAYPSARRARHGGLNRSWVGREFAGGVR